MLSSAASLVPARVRLVIKWLAYAGLTLGSLYVLMCAWLLYDLSYALYLRDVIDASAKNGRGDEVSAMTEMRGPTHPDRTVITLKRASHWFSTTLVEGESFDYLVDFEWKDENTLLLQLDFGCNGFHTVPIETVGPVRIVYRFGDPGTKPERGYETEPRPAVPPGRCE